MASPNVLPMDQLHPGQGQSWSKTFGNGSIEKYHRLANIMSEDKHFAIFRRFDDINLAVLLALQAEIVDLQYQLQVQSQKDNSGQGQRDLLIKLQPKLTEYSKCINLYLVSELSQLQIPRTSQLETLQDWLTDPKGGANFLTKTGTPELYTWKPKDPSHLETTAQRIGLTVVFTVLFAVILELFTNAKRVEIFAATATFAAVEVVFIGSALNSK
ncbi:hypothetical protein FOC1_g10004878 [Fusarium oxysporum f. sp. cubense race 1]|uniref:DUF6594 domain-containing protein n=1 Tax=Fusarium oxysporum f. sp. cubense (strain race 1) TaxID=1229664 RepID=N4UEQ1_FUSC1|nr:hypothetical protein FOC1_g10004878 [Fusarium oxysporum f. sp. cubense race 1]